MQETLTINTSGRGFVEITDQVAARISPWSLGAGALNVFLRHTSASLILCENADPTVLTDLEAWMHRQVPDGDPQHRHDAEGPDDMPAHIRSVLTSNSITLPLIDGRLALGRWQGLFLWEHRLAAQRREIIVTALTGS